MYPLSGSDNLEFRVDASYRPFHPPFLHVHSPRLGVTYSFCVVSGVVVVVVVFDILEIDGPVPTYNH